MSRYKDNRESKNPEEEFLPDPDTIAPEEANRLGYQMKDNLTGFINSQKIGINLIIDSGTDPINGSVMVDSLALPKKGITL